MTATGDSVAGDPATPKSSPAATGTASAEKPTGLSRRAGILLILLLGALVLLSSVPTWVSAQATSALGGSVDLAVTGADAAAGVGAAGLAIVAAAIATGLVGRGGRWVIAIVLGLSSLVVCGSAWTVIQDPTSSAVSAAGRLTGVPEILGSADLTLMPWFALMLGVIGLYLAFLISVRSGAWAASSRRHERTGAVQAPSSAEENAPAREEPLDHTDLWDAQTRGDDEPLQ